MKVYLTSFTGMKLDLDSDILSKALQKRGIQSEKVSWDDPTVDWSKADLVISKSPSNYFTKKTAFINWARKVEETTPLWNTSKIMEWNSDKHYLRDLEAKGVHIPPTIYVEKGSREPLSTVLRGCNWDDIVIKPTISVGAFGLRRFKPGDEAERHLWMLTGEGFSVEFLGDIYTSESQAVIIQPFLSEIFEGEVSLLYFGGRFSHAVLKVAKAGDIRSHPGWGAKVTRHMPSAEELMVGESVIAGAGATHFARIDIVNTVRGPLLIEVELIDPFLFFDLFPETAEVYADHIQQSLN